ncbi:MAG: hypothetical protein ACJ76N_19395 [Thermoanaerobaculia bacterium]
MRALDYLAEQGLLEVRAAGLRHPYRWLRRPGDLDALAGSLHQRTLERETREIARPRPAASFRPWTHGAPEAEMERLG